MATAMTTFLSPPSYSIPFSPTTTKTSTNITTLPTFSRFLTTTNQTNVAYQTIKLCRRPLSMCLPNDPNPPKPPSSAAKTSTVTTTTTTKAPSITTLKISPRRIKHVENLIKTSPVYLKTDLHTHFNLAEWVNLGEQLEDQLCQENPNHAESNDIRIYQYYLPVYFWLEHMVITEQARRQQYKQSHPDSKNIYGEGAVIVGLSCPQGGGKTTITRYLKDMFTKRDMICVIASIDDFYLGYDDQNELSQKYKGNELLEYRGMPGTHDVELLRDTLECLKDGKSCRIPKYDKSAKNGRGDLFMQKHWLKILTSDIDVVLFEGWCLGFEAVPEKRLKAFGDERLRPVNKFLEEYEFLKEVLSAMVIIEVDDVNWVYKWREQAELLRRAGGDGALSEKELKDFVSRFMPSYKLYLPYLYEHPYCSGKELRLRINENRRPIG